MVCLSCHNISAQGPRPTLEQKSSEINKALPEIYDRITKLRTTTVENNNISYHFLVDATPAEYREAFPKVRAQILRTICQKRTERSLLKDFNANIVYRYENVKGMSLGEFMVKPDFCPK